MRIDEFLLARVAEDEEVARAATRGPWRYLAAWAIDDDGNEYVECHEVSANPMRFDGSVLVPVESWKEAGAWTAVAECESGDTDPTADFEHIARHDPARVLAECEAKRRVVELHAPKDPDPYASWKSPEYHEAQRKSWAADGLHYDPNKWLACAECEHKYPCRTLKHLAAVYADHPDFDPAWRL